MNENLPQQTQVAKDWLLKARVKLLANNIKSASLDAELILAGVLDVERIFLHAHPEIKIKDDILSRATELLNKRASRVPLAYLLGTKEFYNRNFIVTTETLIPRPESESIIEILHSLPISHFPSTNPQLIDVGTGSGCLGITAKLEFPNLNVTLSDISDAALNVARKNATELNVEVSMVKSDLLEKILERQDIIIANLPYVDKTWHRSPETDYEPASALFADNNGLALIYKLLEQSVDKLNPNGIVIIEADPTQHQKIEDKAIKLGFKRLTKLDYAISFQF